jgi:hypothetical protein
LRYRSGPPSRQTDCFHRDLNATVDANLRSEPHVFHNGWYGYKNWGIGVACYAHVLRATVDSVPPAVWQETGDQLRVQIGASTFAFETGGVGGYAEIDGRRTAFAQTVGQDP